MPLKLHGMHDLGYKILLDRYAQNDPDGHNNLKVGDVVVAITEGSRLDKYPKREIGQVTKIEDDNVTVAIHPDDNEMTVKTLMIDRVLETTPQQIQARVAKGIASVEETEKLRSRWEEEFMWLMSDWQFVPGGRILTAAGTDQDLTAYNCFVIPSPPDSRGGIIDTAKNMAELMSRGGGVGINISTLRPRRAYVAGVNGRSSGSVSWGALYSYVTGLIEQAGSRRGALMLILNDWHPDIFDFIHSKREAGNITNANISVGISDRFMQAVKDDGDWNLMFPVTSFEKYDEEWDGNLERWIEKGYPTEVYRTLPARQIWDEIIESAWDSAEPGMWFRERSNKDANSYYYPDGELICTNPCVTGDTRLYTNKGLIKMEDLFDDETEFEAVIDSRFGVKSTTLPSTRVFMTGTKPVYELKTREGYKIRATADHRFMTPSGWVELQDLNEGDSIHILNRKGGFGQEGNLELGRLIGWFVGDGTVTTDNRVSLKFYQEEKKELAPAFAGYANEAVPTGANNREYEIGVWENENYPDSRVRSTRLYDLFDTYGLIDNKLQVPEVVFRGTEDMQRGYLQALFSADGGVQYDEKHQSASVRLASNSEELLEQVQMLLSNFGITSRIYRNRRDAGYRKLPDGKGGLKEYWCEAQHELALSRMNMQTFKDEIGFILDAKSDKLSMVLASHKTSPRRENFVARVESVTPDGTEDVYDITQADTHSFVGNSFVVHNCGEEPLPQYGVCNLGALNLSRYYDDKSQDVDWQRLGRAVPAAVRFLDNVIDWTPYHFEPNHEQQMKERRVGLGVMGLADLMIKCGVRYGSPESVEFTEKVFNFIASLAYSTSSDLAAEKGSFPEFDADRFLESGYMRRMPEGVREQIRKKGVRNVTLLTVAPTGTTGTMVNTSTGIEPNFSWVWYRKGRLGMHEENARIMKEWLDEQGLDEVPEKLPNWFVTSMELTPYEHVAVQAAAQKWVDAAISKTVNAPNEYTVEQTGDLYMAMYDLGCKGGTIYRDGSRDEQVLTLKKDNNEAGQPIENPFLKDVNEMETDIEAVNQLYEMVEAEEALIEYVYEDEEYDEEYDEWLDEYEDEDYIYDGEDFEQLDIKLPIHPERMTSVTLRGKTPFGTMFINITEDPEGTPFAVFITVGKSGSDIHAFAESMGRTISIAIQSHAIPYRMSMLRALIDQNRGIGGARPYGFGPNRVSSFADAVAKLIQEEYIDVKDAADVAEAHIARVYDEDVEDNSHFRGFATVSTPYGNMVVSTGFTEHAEDDDSEIKQVVAMEGANMCPDCNNMTLMRQDGCSKCGVCGYSEC